jgi:hypothetical protein
VDLVLAVPGVREMVDACWVDGAKTYLKNDPTLEEKDPNFSKRRFAPPKRTTHSFHFEFLD